MTAAQCQLQTAGSKVPPEGDPGEWQKAAEDAAVVALLPGCLSQAQAGWLWTGHQQASWIRELPVWLRQTRWLPHRALWQR